MKTGAWIVLVLSLTTLAGGLGYFGISMESAIGHALLIVFIVLLLAIIHLAMAELRMFDPRDGFE